MIGAIGTVDACAEWGRRWPPRPRACRAEDTKRLDRTVFFFSCIGSSLRRRRSPARFPPAPVKFKFPEFLNNVARVDWTNQNVFDIVVQRHDILTQEMSREEREFQETVEQEAQLKALEADEGGETSEEESITMLLELCQKFDCL